jgi:hypothetical protein
VKSLIKQGNKLEKIEKILTDCIEEIKSGKATVNECLDRYPSRRGELEPLLKMALNIQKPPVLQLDSSYKQTARARLLQEIRAAGQKTPSSFRDVFSFGIPSRFVWARAAVTILVVVVLLSTLTTGTAYAAQSSLPGDFLYPVKTVTEDARLLIADGNAAKAELNLKFAQTRLEEMSKLSDTDEARITLAVNGYQGNLEAFRKQIQSISDVSTLSRLLNGALGKIQEQTAFCDNVIDTNPRYAKQVKEASDLSINEQVELIHMLSIQNGLQAVQVNLNAMQNRLQRAQEKANGNQYQLMQEALLQYQRFNQLGEQILQSSNQQNMEIEALTLQALSGYLNTLDSIYQRVPQEYRGSIETCKQMTEQFRNQAQYRYQQQGNPDTGSGNSSSGNGDSSAAGQGDQNASQYNEEAEIPGNESPGTTTTPPQGPDGSSGGGSKGDDTGSGSSANSSVVTVARFTLHTTTS